MSTEVPQINLEDLSTRFSCVDYIVFISLLWVSAGIGLYYAGRKMDSTSEFLMAGRSMTTFPVAMSLIASFMSAITLLGTPSEVYSNGFTYWLIGFSYFIVMPVAAYLYLPVFIDLQVTSAYEYLELRFNVFLRMLGSFIFIIQMCLYMAIVVYAPALALAQVTGVNVYLSVSLISFVCIFYTTLGGMKAVLWTDTIQVVIMYGVMVFIIFKGMVDQGGFMAVWNTAVEGGRAELINFDIHPTARHTFWTLLIGGFFTWLTIYGVNQAQVQRYLCVKEKGMAVKALWINLFALFLLMIICAFGGLVVYSRYRDCDPLKSELVSKSDQLLPLFVMDTLGSLKGVPGLFVAGIFSGALSTVSSGMNSLAAITLEDFVKFYFPFMTERKATIISKILSLLYGVLTYGLVFVAEQLGDVLSAALSIFGMVGGPLCGLFSLGMLVPWANSIGAFVGTVFSLCFTFFIGIGYQVAVYNKKIVPSKLPVDISGCSFLNITETTTPLPLNTTEVEDDCELLTLYKTSYLWYSCIGFFSVIVVGTLVSFLTIPRDVKTLNPKLLSPLIHLIKKYIPNGELIGIDYDDEGKEELPYTVSSNSMANVNGAFQDNLTAYQDKMTRREISSKL